MILHLYRLVLRSLLTKGRLIAVGSIAVVLVLLGAATGSRTGIDTSRVTFQLVSNLGLALLVPITSLVFASAALGDFVDDQTLVYAWLAPVPRWKIVLAAFIATVTVCAPLTALPVTLTAVFARVETKLIIAALASSSVALIAYTAIFVGVGLVLRRALAWGLAYVLVWEAIVAGIGTGPARASIRHYSRSVLTDLAGRTTSRLEVSAAVGVIVPAAIALVAIVLTSWRLAHQDVD